MNCSNYCDIQNAYEKTKVSDEIFPSLLDYIQSIKGGMRQMALDIASKKMKPSEDGDKASFVNNKIRMLINYY